jgi:hypothetical protein
LAAAGADLRPITRQIELAHDLRPQIMLISGGVNDLINYEAPLDAMRSDFALLLRRLGKQQITAANAAIAEKSAYLRGLSG